MGRVWRVAHRVEPTATLREAVGGHPLVAALLAQALALFLDTPDHQLELPDFTGRLLVHLDDLANLVDREAEPLAAHDLAHEVPVGRAEQPRAPAPHRRDQPLILVEAQRARRDVELAGQLRDGIIFAQRPRPLFFTASVAWHLRKSQLQ